MPHLHKQLYVLTLCYNNKLLVKGNPRGIRYFTCWSDHMKYNDKALKDYEKTAAFAGNWTTSAEMRVNNLNHCTTLTH